MRTVRLASPSVSETMSSISSTRDAGRPIVRATDLSALHRALDTLAIAVSPTGDGALLADADATLVGKVALDTGVALTELRPAHGAGLEEMFLQLTADTQRDEAAA